MKLTKGKITKLYNKKRQSFKKPKGKKCPSWGSSERQSVGMILIQFLSDQDYQVQYALNEKKDPIIQQLM